MGSRMGLVAVLALTLAMTACDVDESRPDEAETSPMVDEGGAPLYDEGVEPGEGDDSP